MIEGVYHDLLVGRQRLEQTYKPFDTFDRCVVDTQDDVVCLKSSLSENAIGVHRFDRHPLSRIQADAVIVTAATDSGRISVPHLQ